MKNRWTVFAKILISFEVIYVMLVGLLTDIGLPHAVYYLMDAANIALLACIVLSDRKKRLLKAGYVLLATGVWLGFMIVSALFKGPSVLRIAWAVRNWMRGFVLFCGCLMFLDADDLRRFFCLFRGLYLLNCALVVIEYLALDRKGDYLGGIFGSEVGCNGYTNILMCVMLIAELIRSYAEKKVTPFAAFVMLSSMAIAAMEEIKLFYYEFPAIVILLPILFAVKKRLDIRTLLWNLLIAALSFGFGLWLLWKIFPWHFRVLTGEKSYEDYEKASRVSYKISRVHFISEINKLFFGDSIPLRMTGYGFGNCEYSAFSLFTSDFHRLHGDLNYHFFSHQPLYLEGGLIGLILFMLIPTAAALEQGILFLRSRGIDRAKLFGFMFGSVMTVSVIYNNGLRTDLSYLIYFALAAAYVAGTHAADMRSEA